MTKEREPILFGCEWYIDDVKWLFKEDISHMTDDEIYDELGRIARGYNSHGHHKDIYDTLSLCFEIKPKERKEK